MRIGFVLEPYEESHASGMGFVMSELLKEMLKQGSEHEFIVYSTKQVSPSFIPGKYQVVRLPQGFLKKWWWFLCMRKEVDALLFSAPLLPLVPPRGIRSVMICQELGSQKIRPMLRELPFTFLRDQILMRLSLTRTDAVAAASNATARDVRTFYSVPEDKLFVVYDGYQDLHMLAPGAPIDETFTSFFFFAGKVKYRKNVHGIAKAFVIFKQRTNASTKLVIAGDYGGRYYREIMNILETGGVSQDVHFVGYVSGALMYSYYTKALAVVFPSLNEGFGMPIIEAMSLGTPVITSNISSMAEAAGEAALLVNPLDVEDISSAMKRVYSDPSLRETLRTKGYERSKQFSWPKAAREFLTLVESHG